MSRLRPVTAGAVVLLAAAGAVLGYALLAYGTVAPRGILEQEVMERVEASRSEVPAGRTGSRRRSRLRAT